MRVCALGGVPGRRTAHARAPRARGVLVLDAAGPLHAGSLLRGKHLLSEYRDADCAAACQALALRWEMDPPAVQEGPSAYAVLLEELAERVSFLLLHRHQKLMASLYILDISERRYRAAMAAETHAERAHELALAILERETEKIASRRKYSAAPQSGLGDTPQADDPA